MRIALYARVSTTDQSCEMQLHELCHYAAGRPALDRLMQDARARRFDAVLVCKLDRWGRSVADSIRSIQALVSLGIRFLAVTQCLDTDESNPMSRFLLHLLAAFAEFEREMSRERVRAGLRTARANGKALGPPGRRNTPDTARRRAVRKTPVLRTVVATGLRTPFSQGDNPCNAALAWLSYRAGMANTEILA